MQEICHRCWCRLEGVELQRCQVIMPNIPNMKVLLQCWRSKRFTHMFNMSISHATHGCINKKKIWKHLLLRLICTICQLGWPYHRLDAWFETPCQVSPAKVVVLPRSVESKLPRDTFWTSFWGAPTLDSLVERDQKPRLKKTCPHWWRLIWVRKTHRLGNLRYSTLESRRLRCP